MQFLNKNVILNIKGKMKDKLRLELDFKRNLLMVFVNSDIIENGRNRSKLILKYLENRITEPHT